MTSPVSAHPEGAIVHVKAQPGARKTAVVGLLGGAIKVSVTASSEKGKANAAILETLCQALHLRPSQVSLLSGHASQHKRVLVAGLAADELQRRIESALMGARSE